MLITFGIKRSYRICGYGTLKNSPYNPDIIAKRIKSDYVPNPAHDAASSLYNPRKTPESDDARIVYDNALRGEWENGMKRMKQL